MLLGEAKRRFENLKKRYSKKKKAKKDATRSGSGSKEASAAERDLKKYEFLSWLAPFLRLKATEDNLSMYVPQQNTDVEESDSSKSDSDDEGSPVNNKSISSNADNIENKDPNRKRVIRKRPSTSIPSQEDVVLNKIVKVLEEPSQNQDADDVFGMMVSKEMKGLSERNKRKLKNEINNLIFKYQEDEFEPRQRPMQSSPQQQSNRWPSFTAPANWASSTNHMNNSL